MGMGANCIMWNEPIFLGQVAFDVLRHDYHRPYINGKCNRESIEDNILDGVYKGELPAMNKQDVDFVCDLVDDLIEMYAKDQLND